VWTRVTGSTGGLDATCGVGLAAPVVNLWGTTTFILKD